MRRASFMSFAILFTLILVLGITGSSCKEYEYGSPLPGILEVRLRAKNSRTDLIPFSSTNRFGIALQELKAIRDDQSFLRILSDLNAIRRKPDGDTLNLLEPAARDSLLVLGRAYAPPSIYSSLEIEINPDPGLLVVSGIAGSFIQIRQPIPQPPTVQTVSGLRLEVKENKTTVCVVTLDLDSTLVRRTEWFEYHPTLYVSSIQIY